LNGGGSGGSLPDGSAANVTPADCTAVNKTAANDKRHTNAVTPSARELGRARIPNVST
jgi:hypothetical protein